MADRIERVNSWLSTMPAMPMFDQPVSRVTRGDATQGSSSEVQEVKRTLLLFCYDTYGPCPKRDAFIAPKVSISLELVASILEQINANRARYPVKI